MRYKLGEAVMLTGLLIGIAGIVIPFGVLCFHVYSWMQYAIWPSFPVSMVLSYLEVPPPHVSWLGVAAILDWFIDLSIGVVAFLLVPIGSAVAMIGGEIAGPPPPLPPPLPPLPTPPPGWKL